MKRHFVLYKDNDAKQYDHDCWNAYSFATPEEADEFVADLNSPTSVWANEAVTIVQTTVEVSDVLYVEFVED